MKKNTSRLIGKLLMVAIGTFILAISVEFFIIPFNILSGGVAGIAVALAPIFHWNETLVANILIVGLFVIGAIFLGKEFFITTAVSSILYPVFTTLLMYHVPSLSIDSTLASFYGGLLGGIGIGLVMRTGASTGGMDIPPVILHKITGMKISTLVMVIDVITVLLGFLAYDLSHVLIGLVSVFSSTLAIGKVLTMNGSLAKSVQIISDEWEKIIEAIDQNLERGATIIPALGSYSGQKRNVILCVVGENQYNQLIELIHDIDSNAFIITTDATDMHGEGFHYRFRI